MANNNNEGADYDTDSPQDSGSDKSFVGKFVSGLLSNTPLSKWFGREPPQSAVRRRDEDEDAFQPPSKRARRPPGPGRNGAFEPLYGASGLPRAPPEPVAGPSGAGLFFKHNSTGSTNTISSSFGHRDAVNGEDDSDSEESTSGYSSARLAPPGNIGATVVDGAERCEKSTPRSRSLFTTLNESGHSSRSLFGDRSPQMNTSLSTRRPTFNASTFGSPTFVDRTLSTKKILNSPFYNGHTIYGGASAYGRRLGRSAEDFNASARASVRIEPVNERSASDGATLSKTARRILSTLEQYGTPISDAKKIPVAPKGRGMLSGHVGAAPYARTRDRKRASNAELQVPTVPELLHMKQKEKLQRSTVSVRRIATTSKSNLNREEYRLRSEEDGKKYSNKMKSNVRSLRQKGGAPTEPVSEVKLPKVSLPITTLPNFDFVILPPPQNSKERNTGGASSPTESQSVGVSTQKREMEKKPLENGKTGIFTFSDPLVISRDLKGVSAINCFKFSEPLCKKQCFGDAVKLKSDESVTAAGHKIKNNGENIGKQSTVAKGSIMDALRKKDKPSEKWECDTCLVKNDMDKVKCFACDEPKPVRETNKDTTKGFGEQFKLSSDKWECSSCMVRNKNTDAECVACSAAKPGGEEAKDRSKSSPSSTWKCTGCSSSNENESNKCVSCGRSKLEKSLLSSFGDKFKPSGDTWECSACMIRNKKELDKCEACQTPKPQPKQKTVRFEDTFKLPSGTWECPTCMIRNKNDVKECPACQTSKPGEKTAAPTVRTIPTFNFGIPAEWECKTCLVKNKNDLSKCASCGSCKESKEQGKKGFGDVFRIKEGEWDCSSCLVRNKPGIEVCKCCGVSKPGSGGGGDKPTEAGKEEEKKSVPTFNFGIDKSSPVLFKFGIPPAKTETKKEKSEVPVSTPAAPPATTSAPPSSVPSFVFGDVVKTTAPTASTFTFGIVGTQEKIAPIAPIAPVKTTTSTCETTSAAPTVSSNPLLKPNEKLPEKAVPAAVGFKFGLDNSSNLSQKPVSSDSLSVSSTQSKSEATVVFSGGFEPPKSTIPTPTFQFKPTAINGDVNKAIESPFSSKPAESALFATTSKPTESNLFSSKPAESSNLFGSKPGESNNLFSSKPADGSSLFASKPQESNNLFSSKPPESNLFSSKPAESGNMFASKPVENTNLFASKAGESSNLFSSKPIDTANLFASKPVESGNLFTSKPPDGASIFSNKPAESGNLFSSKPAESTPLFSTKPPETTNLFASKPPEPTNLFGNKPEASTNMFASKPPETTNIFASKPPEATNMFAAKPPEGANMFSNAAFKFNVKPPEGAGQQEIGAQSMVFKFGSSDNAPPQPMKKPFGESAEPAVSNGFGSVPKVAAFGTPQPFAFADQRAKGAAFGFGQAPENKAVAAPPAFNFAVGGAPAAPTFNFSSATPAGGFNFGGKIESQPFGGAGGAFGAPPPAAAAAKNGSFNFGTGAGNNSQKAIFTFGASQTAQPQPQQQQQSFPAQTQSGFNFGTPAPPTIPTGGFNFTGAPPSFSFTDGSQSPAQPQRKIKKALRRTHR